MERIGQRYEKVRELGTGGTAVVYEARDHVLGRTCAVKVLLDVGDSAAAEARSRRLRQEAAALVALDHPRVVRVYDLGEHDGHPFLAMEFVPGGSLADRLLASGPLPPSEAVDRMVEVLDALQAAHSLGMVHRDVKPHNVLLRDDGTAALCDFGIARQESSSHTRTGVALGSVDYMAPEQRIDARRAGPAADVYGSGCTLFHLLTGETPVDLYLASDHSPRWDGIPGSLKQILRRATAVDASGRYQSADEMAQDLSTIRPALEGIGPRILVMSGTPSPVPTRGETSERLAVVNPDSNPIVGVEEWAWAAKRGPVAGRSSVWIGLVSAAVMVVVAVLGWPTLEARLKARQVVPKVDTPEFAPPESMQGTWQGNFGDAHHSGTVSMTDAKGDVRGRLVIDLDGNELRANLAGRYEDGRVELAGASATLVCTVDALEVCRGELLWSQYVMPFALVRTSGRPPPIAAAP